VPEAAKALGGRVSGVWSGAPLVFDLRMRANGRMSATITRDNSTFEASGRYVLTGDEATFTLAEAGGDARYDGELDQKGIKGHIELSSGKRNRIRARR
jgi:hypothetical protein